MTKTAMHDLERLFAGEGRVICLTACPVDPVELDLAESGPGWLPLACIRVGLRTIHKSSELVCHCMAVYVLALHFSCTLAALPVGSILCDRDGPQ
jgi:hypothetical protein